MNGCSPGAGRAISSPSSGSLTSSAAESMRTPATPRSNQKRRTSSCSAQTSGCVQLRSGCSGAKRWRYHSPSVDPRPRRPAEDRLPAVRRLGRRPSPRPGRNQKRARSGEPGAAASASWNHGCSLETWFGTTSTIVRMPSSARLRDQLLGLVERPERRVDRAVVDDVVAVVGERRRVPGVEPERVDAEVAQVRQLGADAGEVADAVAVPVGEAPDVDLVDDRVAPPRPVRRSGPGTPRPRLGDRIS